MPRVIWPRPDTRSLLSRSRDAPRSPAFASLNTGPRRPLPMRMAMSASWRTRLQTVSQWPGCANGWRATALCRSSSSGTTAGAKSSTSRTSGRRSHCSAISNSFYRLKGSDVDFDREFPPEQDAAMRLRTRNALNLLGLDAADRGQSPTQWQRSQYPQPYRDRIAVVHEGIDTTVVKPDATARLWLSGGRCLSRADEIVTYSARDLEPYRGFHVFMRALPDVLKRRPEAQVLILGGNGVSYGRRPERAETWRAQLLAELDGVLDLRRIHFLGHLPYQQYLTVLQISSVHVYLTYPFVLSWSLLEALAAGCLVVSSLTPPVEEVICDGDNGWLVDFFDVDGLAERIVAALAGKEDTTSTRLRAAARQTVIARYDLSTVCLPAYLDLLRSMLGSSKNL